MKGFWKALFTGSSDKPVGGVRSESDDSKMSLNDSLHRNLKKSSKWSLVFCAVIVLLGLLIVANPFRKTEGELDAIYVMFDEMAAESQPDVKIKKREIVEISQLKHFGVAYSPEYFVEYNRRIMLNDTYETIKDGDVRFIKFAILEKKKAFDAKYSQEKELNALDSLQMDLDAMNMQLLATASNPDYVEFVKKQLEIELKNLDDKLESIAQTKGYEVVFQVKEVENGVKGKFQYRFLMPEDKSEMVLDKKMALD